MWCFWAFVVEALLYLFYRSHAARFHWMVHFLVGASTALILMSLSALRARKPVHLPLVWIGVGHLFAMAPDVLFVVGVAHEQWMDVFLGHVSVHFVPGRNATLLAVFALSLGGYLSVLHRRVRPEGREVPERALVR